MQTKKALITTAVGGLIAMAQFALHAQPAEKPSYSSEKCYGVATAGKNDCAANGHACAGQSKAGKNANEWVYLPVGTCAKSAAPSSKCHERDRPPRLALRNPIPAATGIGLRANASERVRRRPAERGMARGAQRELLWARRDRACRARASPRELPVVVPRRGPLARLGRSARSRVICAACGSSAAATSLHWFPSTCRGAPSAGATSTICCRCLTRAKRSSTWFCEWTRRKTCSAAPF